MDEMIEKQINTFQSACSIIQNCFVNENISLINPPHCDKYYVPNGFPNFIKFLEYELVRSKSQHAEMTLKICSSNSGTTFDSIEIVCIDASPKRKGMGTELFRQVKHLAYSLYIPLIWGNILDPDAAEFYKAVGCEIIGDTFRYVINEIN